MINWLKKLILMILVGFFKKREYGSKISKMKGKNPSFTGLVLLLVLLLLLIVLRIQRW